MIYLFFICGQTVAVFVAGIWESPVFAAVIAGAFTTVNTLIALLLVHIWERHRGAGKGTDRRADPRLGGDRSRVDDGH